GDQPGGQQAIHPGSDRGTGLAGAGGEFGPGTWGAITQELEQLTGTAGACGQPYRFVHGHSESRSALIPGAGAPPTRPYDVGMSSTGSSSDPRPILATLRRYLVDAELLERTRSGSEYALVAD